MLAPMLVDGIDGAAEDGMGLVEIPPAAGPLRPLPGEDHRNPTLALVRCGDGGFLFRKGIERVGQIGANRAPQTPSARKNACGGG